MVGRARHTPSERPVVVVVLAPGDDDPPGMDTLRSLAALRLARTPDELAEAIAEADILFVWDFRTTSIPDAFKRAERLEWVHTASAGVDAVMFPEMARSTVTLTNSRGVFDRGIAEFCLAAMLFFAKDIRTTIDLQREHRWQHRETELVAGKHLVVVGAGSIGREVATLAKAAGMRVTGIARRERDDPVLGRVAPHSELHQHLREADFVAVTAPLTPQTEGMIDSRALAALKPGARLINVGRGPVVVEQALLDALRSGHVAGAALDVFDTEPLPENHPFWDMPNVLVSHHMSGDFVGWKRTLVELFEENLRRYRDGEPLVNVVDKQAANDPPRKES